MSQGINIKGVDYAWSHPQLQTAWDLGYRFASRYLSWLPNGKVIGSAERDALLSIGFDISLNWEFGTNDALIGSLAGDSQAREAVRQAFNLGYPSGSTIYFSYDFNATPAQQGVINSYAGAARQRCHDSGFRAGAYGGYWVIKRLFEAGLIDDGWQTYAWSGGLWHPNATLRQIQNGVNVGGADTDIDEEVGPVYFWRHSAIPAPVPINTTRKDDEMKVVRANTSGGIWTTTGVEREWLPTMAAVYTVLRVFGVNYSDIIAVDDTELPALGEDISKTAVGVSLTPAELAQAVRDALNSTKLVAS